MPSQNDAWTKIAFLVLKIYVIFLLVIATLGLFTGATNIILWFIQTAIYAGILTKRMAAWYGALFWRILVLFLLFITGTLGSNILLIVDTIIFIVLLNASRPFFK